MALIQPVAFSKDGNYFATCANDGTLKVWNTVTGQLKQEYVPSSHLSASCSCLAWSNWHVDDASPRKKKKRMRTEDLELIAIGTATGNILVYSVAKGDLHTQLSGGHSTTVHCACWSSQHDTLYSCAADGHIVEWNVATSSVSQRWRADKGGIYSLCLCQSGKHLLSAGRSIKLWDLDTRSVLQTFAAHTSEVFQLLHVSPAHDTPNGDADVAHDDIDNSYVLSAALSERLINASRIQTASGKDKFTAATFSLPEDPIQLNVKQPASSDDPLILAAVTRGGQACLFETTLNGKSKRPVQAKVTIQVATDSAVPVPLSICGVHISSGSAPTLTVAYGSLSRAVFERLQYKGLDSSMCLVRPDPLKSVVQVETPANKVRSSVVTSDAVTLTPSHQTPAGPMRAEEGGKRQRKRSRSVDMTLEDRLKAIGLDKQQASGQEVPKANNLATLLSQGLQSEDKCILNNVLQHSSESLIRNTIRKLPLTMVVPLVQELSRRLQGHSQSGHTIVKWIKALLTLHTSYLITYPDLVHSLSNLYHMVESRVSTFSRLSRLQGKLDLLLSQASSRDTDDSAALANQSAVVYQDESSEEDFPSEDVVAYDNLEPDWDEDEEAVNEAMSDSDAEDGGGDSDMDSDAV